MRPATVFAAFVCALVAAGVVVAFVAIGTPTDARRAALDLRRERDLSTIAATLHRHGVGRGLPLHLPDAFDASTPMPRDPETRQPYAYRRLNARRYRICASFSAPADNRAGGWTGPFDIRWPHENGTTCYELDADDEPPAPKRLPRVPPIRRA
jgi:hypothetical protein